MYPYDEISIYVDCKKPKKLFQYPDPTLYYFIEESPKVYKITIKFDELSTYFDIYLGKKTKKYKNIIDLISQGANKKLEKQIIKECKELILKEYVYKFSFSKFSNFLKQIKKEGFKEGEISYKSKIKNILKEIMEV